MIQILRARTASRSARPLSAVGLRTQTEVLEAAAVEIQVIILRDWVYRETRRARRGLAMTAVVDCLALAPPVVVAAVALVRSALTVHPTATAVTEVMASNRLLRERRHITLEAGVATETVGKAAEQPVSAVWAAGVTAV